jgi:hypothetical protein
MMPNLGESWLVGSKVLACGEADDLMVGEVVEILSTPRGPDGCVKVKRIIYDWVPVSCLEFKVD